MKIAILRIVCFATAAGAITAMAALSATTGNAASVGTSITVEVKREPVASIQELKAQYRRPTSISFPKDNPYTIEKVDLAKNCTSIRACRSQCFVLRLCHSPCLWVGGWSAEGRWAWHEAARSSVSTIVNAAFGQIFMWDGRASSLEEQALGPIRADVEMNLPLTVDREA